jgi:cell division protein FtsA
MPGRLCAIDVGTTKICAFIATADALGAIKLLGLGCAPSKGVARGVVVDIQAATASIIQAVREAEKAAGTSMTHAVVGISGSHISAINSHGMTPIRNRTVTDADMHAALSAAQAVAVAEGHQILHAVPQTYLIDGTERVTNPRGMAGMRLEVFVHLITGSAASVHNLISCVEQAGIRVSDVILEPLASAEAVLSPDERELGVGMLDIGGGTSDFTIYQAHSIRHTAIIPVAGTLFTSDLAVCLRTSMQEAERLKREYGESMLGQTGDELIAIELADGMQASSTWRHTIASILSARADELAARLAKEIDAHHVRLLMPCGLVVTGGGALLRGLDQHLSRALNLPTRIGLPRTSQSESDLSSPIFATGYGLLCYTRKMRAQQTMATPLVGRLLQRMRSWVTDFF